MRSIDNIRLTHARSPTVEISDPRRSHRLLVTSNAAGQTQHVVASYRPRSSLLLLSRALREKFASTPYGKQFAASES
jgi:hypothetical protein